MWQKTVFVAVVALATTDAAIAGDVYKCTVGGTSVYQDSPCASGKKIDITGSVVGVPLFGGRDIHAMGFGEMESRLRASTRAERVFIDQMNQEVTAVRARYGLRDGKTALAEIARIQTEYRPRIAREHATYTALIEEMRVRCPRGAAISASRQTCGK